MNLLNVFHHKVFSVSFLISEKKTTVMKSLSIYFGHHSLAFLNSFLNILNKYNVLILDKYNLKYALLMNLFFNIFGTEGRRDGGREPTGRGSKGKDKGPGPRVEKHKHPLTNHQQPLADVLQNRCP